MWYAEFIEAFPDDDVCLALLWEQRYGALRICPQCRRYASYYRVRRRKMYECGGCGHMIAPLAHTIFHKSSTPLTMWFYAIYLYSVAERGISAKELERTLGVTYKTAWRMLRKVQAVFAVDNFDAYCDEYDDAQRQQGV